jgi:hypothetical protein
VPEIIKNKKYEIQNGYIYKKQALNNHFLFCIDLIIISDSLAACSQNWPISASLVVFSHRYGMSDFWPECKGICRQNG